MSGDEELSGAGDLTRSHILKMGSQRAAEMDGQIQKKGTSAASGRSSRVFLSLLSLLFLLLPRH